MHPRHTTDAAARMAKAVLPIFAPLLRNEELVDAYREVRDALAPEVERLLAAYDRERTRVAPGRVAQTTDAAETLRADQGEGR